MARPIRILEAGERAPDFDLPLPGGGTQSLKDLLVSGPVLLAFFKVSCPVCQFTFPFLERFHRGGITVAGISQDNASATRDFNEEFGVSFPTLLDGQGYPVSESFGISYVPTMFLVEGDGTIGVVSEGFVKKELEDMAARFDVVPFKPGEYVPEWKAG